MATKKTAAKKAAAPKVEPVVEPVDDIAGVGIVEASGTVGVAQKPDLLGEWPLTGEDYFHPRVVARRAHSGDNTADRNSLLSIQRVGGAQETGVYDDQTAEAYVVWRQSRGLPPTLVVDKEAWQLLRDG